ncbi:MAG: hypothetical protein KAS18_02150 [Calditrichia bacterium]|nr:hypothetical protein [Calditrichia bacterium]
MNNNSNLNNNYYLANMQPSLKVIIDIKADVSAANFRSILSFCKQWNIKDIILKIYDLTNTKIFDHLYNAIADTFLFTSDDFNFFLQFENLEISLIKKFWKSKENPKDFLLPLLIHSGNFEVQLQSFGTKIVRLFDSKPEIITSKIENNKINLVLYNPDNVFALFIQEKQDTQNNSFQTVDLQKHFNRKTGKVIIPWKNSKEVNVYIIRKIFGYFNESVYQKLNYLSEKVFKSYLSYIDDHLDRNSSLFKGWLLNPYKVSSQPNNSIPVNSYFSESFAGKKGQDYSKIALNFWYKSGQDSHHQRVDLFNISREETQKVFKKSYDSHIKSNDKKLIFQLSETGDTVQENGMPLYLFDFAQNINDFNVSLDSKYILPNGTYTKQKETELRIVSAITHHYENKNASVKCGNLLNTGNSFENKLWYVNWLVSCGINNIMQLINIDFTELKTNLYSNLPTYDPSYLAYEKWFNYVNSISHFSRKGVHKCDILILYPIESYFYGNVVQMSAMLPLIANEGFDFDLIDYNAFSNNDICKIMDNKLSINKEKYSILILPGVEIIPIEVLRKIHDYYSAGGTVIAIGHLPTKSTKWDNDNSIESISNEIWFQKSSISSTKFKTNKWGGKGYFQSNVKLLTDVIKENKNLLNLQIHSKSGEIRSLVRELPTEYYILLFNMSTTHDFQGIVYSKYKGRPSIWDFDKNEAKPYYNFNIKDSYLQFPVTIPAKQSKLIILKKQSLKSLPKILKTNFDEISNIKIQNQKITVNALVKDKGKYEVELNMFNINKSANVNITKFLPVLTISNNNWNIEFNNKRIIDSLGDLSRYDHTFSGTIIYKKIIIISKEYLNGFNVILDMGKVKDIIEIWINEKNLGLYILPPFRLDISDHIVSGDNKFEFRVKNNLFNAQSSLEVVNQNNFYIKEYGLFGPVKIIPYKEIQITC